MKRVLVGKKFLFAENTVSAEKYNFGGKYVFGGKLHFWRENAFLAVKYVFVILTGKRVFRFLAGKCIFVVLPFSVIDKMILNLNL